MTTPYAFYQFWLNADDARRRRATCMSSASVPARRSRRWRRRPPSGRPPRGAARPRPRASPRSCTARLRPRTRCVAASQALFGRAIAGGPRRARRWRRRCRAAARRGRGRDAAAADGRPVRRAGLAPSRPPPGARWPRAAPTSTTSGSPTTPTCRRPTTCCTVAGWFCAAASATSRRSRWPPDEHVAPGDRAAPGRPGRPRAVRAPAAVGGGGRGTRRRARLVGRAGVVDGAAPGTDVQYRCGSITKTFVAVSVMRLRDEDLLDLSDPLERHLPGTELGQVPVAQLLAHLWVSGPRRRRRGGSGRPAAASPSSGPVRSGCPRRADGSTTPTSATRSSASWSPGAADHRGPT